MMGEDRTAATSQHKPVQILVPFVLLQLKKKEKKNQQTQTNKPAQCGFAFFFFLMFKIKLLSGSQPICQSVNPLELFKA